MTFKKEPGLQAVALSPALCATEVGIVGKHDSWITDLSVPPAKYYEDKKPDDPHLL